MPHGNKKGFWRVKQLTELTNEEIWIILAEGGEK